MKKTVCFVISMLCAVYGFAQAYPVNQKAAELSYELKGDVNNDGSPNVYYHITLKMLVECSDRSPAALPLFIHDISNNTVKSYNWAVDSASNRVHVADPCIAFPTSPCFRFFYFYVNAPADYNNGGYLVFFADCCRGGYANLNTTFNASIYEGIDLHLSWSALDNTRPGSGPIHNGMAYQFTIPARSRVPQNSSPTFNSSSDTILYVCTNMSFSHIFSATDPDGDSLVYSFYPSKVFNTEASQGAISIQTSAPLDATYAGPNYTMLQPLGEGVNIDSKTGTISGRMHDTGSFLFTIAAYEYRDGKLISTVPHTREAILHAYDCSKFPTPKAILPPLINTCNATTVTFPNNTTPYHPELDWDNNQYLWSLGDGDTSHVRNPVHTFDTGTYNVRLITMAGYRCADTAYSKLLVYPSVHPNFTISGMLCTDQPIKFTSTSTTDIGSINGLKWSFVNLKDSSSFTSRLSNPTYSFKVPDQTYAAILDVTTTKGCDAKDTQLISIRQSPLPLQVNDTVITAGVPYQLYANSGYDTTGSRYTWMPSTGLDNPFSANPIATGTQDITYRVQVSNSFGCSLSDTVHLIYYKGPDIYLPAAFTPNGDGKNDIFRPFPVGIQKLEYFRVFDRWGNTVYQTQTYLAGWDGSIGGRLAPAGTYIYEARGKDFNSKTVFKKGSVFLLR